MRLTEAAEHYVQTNGLRSRMIVSNCRRFERHSGTLTIADITPEAVIRYRTTARECGLSPVTIEKTLTDTATICKVHGVTLVIGKRLARRRPEPHPVPIEDIDAVFCIAAPWLKQWLALTYWTGARLADSIKLQLAVTGPCEVLRLQASKTGHCHRWPVPDWLMPLLQPVDIPYRYSSQWFCKLLRSHLCASCCIAGVPVFCPQRMRQRAITEWSRANGMAGAIVHGSGLNVLGHYVDPLSVLESAMHRVRVPPCFGASVDDSESMLLSFRRLDPSGQRLIRETTQRLAGG